MERISELKAWYSKITPSNKNKEKMIKNEQNLQKIWNYVKKSNLWLTDILKRKGEKPSKLNNIFKETIHENVPYLATEANI